MAIKIAIFQDISGTECIATGTNERGNNTFQPIAKT